MRRNIPEELLQIHNLTSGNGYEIDSPGRKSTSMAAWGAGLVTLGAAALIQFTVLGETATYVTLFAVFAVTWWLLKRRLAPIHELDPARRAELSAAQTLLSNKQGLVDLRDAVRAEMREHEELSGRLAELKAKMLRVGLDIYRDRVAAIDRALETIEQQLVVDRRLLDGYDKSIIMLEIEYETAATADALPEMSGLMSDRLVELESLREQQTELTRLLSANAEVEALLRGRSA